MLKNCQHRTKLITSFIKRSLYKEINAPASYERSFMVLPEYPSVNEELTIQNIDSISFPDIYADISKTLQDHEASIAELFVSNKHGKSFDENLYQYDKLVNIIDNKVKLFRLAAASQRDPILIDTFPILAMRSGLMANHILSFEEFRNAFNDYINENTQSNIYSKAYVNKIHDNCSLFGAFLKPSSRVIVENHIKQIFGAVNSFIQTESTSREKMVFTIYDNVLTEDAPVSGLLNDFIGKSNPYDIRADGQTPPVFYALPFASIYFSDYITKYIKDHLTRLQIWRRSRQYAGSGGLKSKDSNEWNINCIQDQRLHISKLLGYRNYVEMLLGKNQRMAKSVDDIFDVLDGFKNTIIPEAIKEYNELNLYAQKNENLSGRLCQWDYHYIQHLYSTKVLNKPDTSVNLFEKVLQPLDLIQRMLKLMCSLYGINISQVESHTNDNSSFKYLLKDDTGRRVCLLNFEHVMDAPRNSIETGKLMSINYEQYNEIPCFLVKVSQRDEYFQMQYIDTLVRTIERCVSWLFCPEKDVTEIFLYTTPEMMHLHTYLIYKYMFSSEKTVRYLFPNFESIKIRDIMNHFSSPYSQYTLLDVSHNLYKAYFDIKFGQILQDYQQQQNQTWKMLFDGKYFPYEPSDQWLLCDEDMVFKQGVWSGLSKYSQFWVTHYGDKVFDRFVGAGYMNWDPNTTIQSSHNSSNEMNDNLREVSLRFRHIFYDDLSTRKPHQLLPTFLD